MDVQISVNYPVVDHVSDYDTVQTLVLRQDHLGEAEIVLVLRPGENGDGVVDFVTDILKAAAVTHYTYSAKPGVEWTPDWNVLFPPHLDEVEDDPDEVSEAEYYDELDLLGFCPF